MIRPIVLSSASGEHTLAELPAPLPLDRLAPGDGPWEVELGFGKGRYILRRAAEDPGRRFLGVEVVSLYYRRVAERARKRGYTNLVAVRAEALYLISAALPRRFAAAVHVYFPDPWPKSRHHKRRLFDPETVDLVLGLLAPGGTLAFATDHLDYGETVADILATHPRVDLYRLPGPWPEGPRTNYEAKYVTEGRPIVRLEARLKAQAGYVDGSVTGDSAATGEPAGAGDLHPAGAPAVLAGVWGRSEPTCPG
jgi:tRNA (guanine-N7-)-methyltransferase